jgi:hypothetical protein
MGTHARTLPLLHALVVGCGRGRRAQSWGLRAGHALAPPLRAPRCGMLEAAGQRLARSIIHNLLALPFYRLPTLRLPTVNKLTACDLSVPVGNACESLNLYPACGWPPAPLQPSPSPSAPRGGGGVCMHMALVQWAFQSMLHISGRGGCLETDALPSPNVRRPSSQAVAAGSG